MLDEGNEWHFTTCYSGCITDVYVAYDDTVVGILDYKILDGFHYVSRTFLLREDVSDKKVYLMKVNPTKNDEYLLYDFSLVVGDTIEISNPISPFPSNGGYFRVDSIVSRPIADGNNYRHFYLSPTASNTVSTLPATWVESIGSLSLINSPGGYPDINEVGHLSCAFKGGDLHYAQFDSISDCSLLYDLSVEVPSIKYAVYPSITDDEINVIVEQSDIDLKIISIRGQLMKQMRLNQGKNVVELDIDKGIYLIQLTDRKGSVETTKVVLK